MFFSVSIFFAVDRPLLFLEYLLVGLFLYSGYRKIAIAVFISLYLLDIYFVVYQIHSFGGLIGILQLLPYFWLGNFSVQLFCVSLGVILITLTLMLWCSSQTKKEVLFVCVLATISAIWVITYNPSSQLNWKKSTSGLAASLVQTLYLKRYVLLHGEAATASVRNVESAVSLTLNNAVGDKLFLVIAESLGIFSDQELQSSMFKDILEVRGNSISGELKYQGNTVNGELRELCGVNVERHMNVLASEFVSTCLPRLYGSSLSIHGATKDMYLRESFYGELGFQVSLFKENGLWSRECYSFPGACDDEIISWMRTRKGYVSSFDFVYYLTLNSHFPYDPRDSVDPDSTARVCDDYGLAEQLCTYYGLHTATLNNIAALISEPEFADFDVLIVGDHPPIITDKELERSMFLEGLVPFVYLPARRGR
jgi:hypothetical protein